MTNDLEHTSRLQQDIPFPRVKSDDVSGSEQDDNAPVNTSPDSQTTSSSKETSSDKLSALPVSTNSPNPNRLLRSPNISTNSNINARGFRRSLDASTSLPSFATDSPSLNNTWKATHNLNSHIAPSATFPRIGVSVDDRSKQRVSFDSDRASAPTPRAAPSRVARGSDPVMPSPVLRSSAYVGHREPHKDAESPSPRKVGSRSSSQSRSRAASPLRMFQQWSAGLHRSGHRTAAEEPFVPVDPFKLKAQVRFPRLSSLVEHNHNDIEHGTPAHACSACIPTSSTKISFRNTHIFVSDTLPRQVYLNLLLRLPAMYFSRVARIFQDAEVSRPDIQRMIDASGGNSAFMALPTSEPHNFSTLDSNDVHNMTVYPPGTLSPGTAAGIGLTGHVGAAASVGHVPLPFPDQWTPPLVSPALMRFKLSWEAFIDSLLREWKTLNVVSALLLSAILTMFQIPSAEEDPVTRTAALLSLICAIMSLTYGCMYIVRFGTMRSMYRASRWAEEARKTDTLIWWNVWVLLAMPSVWMSWSMVFFIVSILSFLWRTGSVLDPDDRPPLSARAALGPRIAITVVFGIGMVYFVMIVKTLRSYGTHAAGMGVHVPAGGATHEQRARDVETAMDRRGRERERSASGWRRREESPERDWSGHNTDVGKEKGGLRGALGLGLTGLGLRGRSADNVRDSSC